MLFSETLASPRDSRSLHSILFCVFSKIHSGSVVNNVKFWRNCCLWKMVLRSPSFAPLLLLFSRFYDSYEHVESLNASEISDPFLGWLHYHRPISSFLVTSVGFSYCHAFVRTRSLLSPQKQVSMYQSIVPNRTIYSQRSHFFSLSLITKCYVPPKTINATNNLIVQGYVNTVSLNSQRFEGKKKTDANILPTISRKFSSVQIIQICDRNGNSIQNLGSDLLRLYF